MSRECSHCGLSNASGVKFCVGCGKPVSAPGARNPQPPTGGELTRLLRLIHKEPTGLAAGGVVLVFCVLIARIGWTPLSWLPRYFGRFVPESRCVGHTPGTFMMYVCSAKVAAFTVVGSVLFLLLIVVLRKPLKRLVKLFRSQGAGGADFLIAPLFATLVFTAAWAGVHYSLEQQVGLVSQRMFPVIIGVFTFVMQRYGSLLQRALGPLFTLRDQFPTWIRYPVAFLIPVLFSLIVTFEDRVTEEALKEQQTVLLAMAAGFLVLAPHKPQKSNLGPGGRRTTAL